MNKVNKMNKMNKRADTGSKWISPWLFVVFAVIGGLMALGILIFYSVEGDVRLEESRILSNKVLNSLVEGGYLKNEVFMEEFNLLEVANLNPDKFVLGGEFFIYAAVFQEGILLKEFLEGEKDFLVQCTFEGEQFAKCYEVGLIVLNESNPQEKFKLKIVTGSNQQGARI